MFGTVLPRVRIPELYLLNTHSLMEEFHQLARNRVPPLPSSHPPEHSLLKLIPDPQFRRLHATVDMELALRLFNVYRYITGLLGDCEAQKYQIIFSYPLKWDNIFLYSIQINSKHLCLCFALCIINIVITLYNHSMVTCDLYKASSLDKLHECRE